MISRKIAKDLAKQVLVARFETSTAAGWIFTQGLPAEDLAKVQREHDKFVEKCLKILRIGAEEDVQGDSTPDSEREAEPETPTGTPGEGPGEGATSLFAQ